MAEAFHKMFPLGERPDYEPDLNFKKAKTESSAQQKQLL